MISNRLLVKIILVIFFMGFLCAHAAVAGLAKIESINLENSPYAIRIKLSSKVPYKVVQFDKKEILVAVKDIDAGDIGKLRGNGKPNIEDVRVAKQKRGVVSLIISTRSNVMSVSSVWIPIGNTLLVKPVFKKSKGTKKNKPRVNKYQKQLATIKPGAKSKLKPALESQTEIVVTDEIVDDKNAKPIDHSIDEIGFKLGNRVFDERFSGTTADLFLELRSDACEDETGGIKKAIVLCKQDAWGKAFEIFSDFIENDTLSKRCLENIYILRAYSFFRDTEKGSDKDYLEAADYFQELISVFPNSIYTPYAITAMGKIHVGLKDYAQAEGYFKIVLKIYRDYPGTPEVMFELGRIYTEKKNTKLAIAMLRKVVEQFPNGSFIGQAKIALGKSLFNQNDFYAAIKIFEDVVKTNERLVYKRPELLLFLGNSYYHTNQSNKARRILSKVYNIFPETKGRDTILARIGDTYVENKQIEKATDIFKLVIKKYPGTDGYVISSMRLAEFLEGVDEKKKLYNMIIDEYSDNPLSRLALMRLAILFNKEGEYETSVDTVKKLLATEPRALKNDAVNLLQNSTESIFKKQISQNEYARVLARYENDKRLLDKTESPGMFLLVGKAYLKAHLYESAIEQLMKAYKRTGRKKRSADLIYSLGVSMDEAGRKDEAYNMLKTYDRNFSRKSKIVDVQRRMGTILLADKKFAASLLFFDKAFGKSKKNKEKAAILVSKSKGYRGLKNYSSAVNSLIKALNMISAEPGDSFALLSMTHRSLGENYMDMQEWGKASDAFNMAVKFAGTENPPTELYFLLGEALQNERKYKQAVQAYQNVVQNGDSFWSSMAKERLRGMKLNNRLENT